ncbi:serologically defined colon cancer antigen 8 homolog isoform X2 [Homalodisca vitripennis]|uniref:serologically defined colon cancer antigen 8 homolog isoform X2 n=1 Tax=Homalodisca vitripennis TaxID=197043 RepID=UPI001EEC7CE3|nr:serologically defined colon cancer antigen 8 homolog isoform X2 [Homalodisca vitripennis]
MKFSSFQSFLELWEKKSQPEPVRKSGKMEGFRKKTADYTDIAYREAVTKLRYLLAESYTPSTGFSKYSLGHYHPYIPTEGNVLIPPTPRPALGLTLKKPETEGQPPPELMSFIQRQEEYIEQLEKESQYCRDELSNLMGKVKEVITENEGLHERRKSGMLQSLFDSFEMEDDEEDDDASSEDKVESRPSKKKHFIGPNIMFESRISELEAQLTQTKMELKKAVEEAESLRKRVAEQGLPSQVSSVLPHASDSELYRQIDALQREREELNDMINKLHASIAQLREKEANVSQKLKRSLDAVDQAHFEKNQSEMEVRRLKNELERMNEKQRESMGEQSRRLAEVERRYAAQTEQLSADLSAQWENATKLGMDLEKQRRTETELRRELMQRNTTLEELKKELNTKTSALQSELLASTGEREGLQAEVAALRLAVERAERAGRQDTARLQAEVTSLRQRLDRADADLLHARKENLRLTDQIASLEKELHLAKLTHEGGENQILKDSKREKELTSMILDMDAKHVQNLAELEGMIQSQSQLMEKLKGECHTLTEKLEDTSLRHKEAKSSLREENEKLVERLAGVWESCKELHSLCTQYGLAVPVYSYTQEMTEWSGNMNSRSMPNSPRRVDMPLTIHDLSLPRLYL